MRWTWKRNRKSRKTGPHGAKRCEVCRAKLPTGSAVAFIKQVYVAAGEKDFALSLCSACWQRHLSFAADAEARFRRENPVEEVCAWLRDRAMAERAATARDLGRLAVPRAVPDLGAALAREPAPNEAFEEIAKALGVFGGDDPQQALVAIVHQARCWSRPDLGDDYGPSRADMAAEALVRIGGSALLVQTLLDMLEARKARGSDRQQAAHELADTAYRSTVGVGVGVGLMPCINEELAPADRASMLPPLLPPLRAALRDTDPWVREHAATALGHLGDTGAVEELTALLSDEDKRVRYFAAQALARLPS